MTINSLKSKNKIKLGNYNSAFTLVELLVVVSIIGILIGLSIFGLQGARESSRDSKRKSDLELLRSGLEIYKSDCNAYPEGFGNPTIVLATNSISLTGNDSNPSCSSNNTYVSQIPTDPTSPNRSYVYSSDGSTYEICGALEQIKIGNVTCGGSSDCGTNTNCNYKVVNP